MKRFQGLTGTIRFSLLAVLAVSIALMTACPQSDSGGGGSVDKSSLTKKITEANTLYSSLKESANGSDIPTTESWVTPAQKAALKSAIDAAQAVANKADATEKEVSNALAALTTAYNTANTTKKPGTQTGGGVDKSALNTKITEANTLYNSLKESSAEGADIPAAESWVTPAQKTALKSAIDAAQAVANKADATAEEVAGALTALNTAYDTANNAKKPGTQADKSALNAKLTEANTLYSSLKESADGSDILTIEYWVTTAQKAALKSAIDAAKAVADKAAATTAEVSGALTALNTAYDTANAAKKPGAKQPTAPIVTGSKGATSGTINLTTEGSVDWVQFPNNSLTNYAKKNVTTPAIQNIAVFGGDLYNVGITDAPFNFTAADAAPGVNPVNRAALQIKGQLNSGYSFTLPYRSNKSQKLKVYSSVWGGDITLEFLVNGTVYYTGSYGKGEDSGQTGQCFEINFQVFETADNVSVRLYCSKDLEAWGGASHGLQAITLSEES